MKHIFFCLLVSFPLFAMSQIGLKAGVNFANVTNASAINSSNQSGFMIGAFLRQQARALSVPQQK